METKIKLETATSYHLPLGELKKMHLYLALAKYHYRRKPNYNEDTLLELLSADFKNLQTEIQTLIEQIPNNNALHKILIFFQYHNTNLKRIAEVLEDA